VLLLPGAWLPAASLSRWLQPAACRCPPAAAGPCPVAAWPLPAASRFPAARWAPARRPAAGRRALCVARPAGCRRARRPACRSAAAALDLRRRRALPPWTPAAALATPHRLAAGLPPCLPALAAATADLGRAGGSSVPVGAKEEDRRGLGHWGVGSCFGLSRLGLLG